VTFSWFFILQLSQDARSNKHQKLNRLLRFLSRPSYTLLTADTAETTGITYI